MKRILPLIILLISALAASAAGPLDKCISAMRAIPSIKVAYTLTAEGNKSQGMLTLAGDRFTLSAPGMMTWFDGKTQWTYSSAMGEVNIVEPTPEELQQINPFAIIRTFSTSYDIRNLGSKAGVSTVQLTARSKSADIRSVRILLSDATSFPTRITLTLSSGKTVDIAVNQVMKGGKLPDTFFRFDRKLYPKVQVVDLR